MWDLLNNFDTSPIRQSPQQTPPRTEYKEPISLPIILVEEVPDDLLCPVCLDVMDDPVKTPCNHNFCSNCILQEVEQRQRCPMDRSPLRPSDLRVNIDLQKKISELKIHCFYGCKWENNEWVIDEEGCQSFATLGNRSDHEQNCPFRDQSDDEQE